ncbi:hypothetical protein BJX63DRAFT_427277 [Aspergillus granulosus]|uniref:Protein kinase domain-containing protein n=1 Tax=Aspergillus granulosus TaxID=176169 RepID=A0ABR4I2G1_9EURO
MAENKPDNVTSGVLTVKLGWAFGLSLPDPMSENWRERWRPYVIAEYEGLQLSSEDLDSIPTKGLVSWVAWHRPFRFDLFPSLLEEEEELTLSLFVSRRDFDATTRSSSGEESEPRGMSLGLVKMNPFLIGSGTRTVDVQNGTGSVELEISYTQKEISSLLKTWADWIVRGGKKGASDRGLVYVEKKDSGRSYGMEAIDTPRSVHDVGPESGINMASSLTLRAGIQHPFIAPLRFAFVSDDGRLELLSPLGSGGYLSDHVQRERRFGIPKARHYAAELVCILEYLHGKNIIIGSLKVENILLDSSGHASLCKPSLYALESSKDRECILPSTPPYPAPEDLLSDSEPSRAGDWWSLGIILYELLTGAPPFYHKDNGERRHKIIHHDLLLPVTLTSSAKDILTKLLDKDPTHRLGANGVAEVKVHPFFDGLKWDECVQRKLATPFKPYDASMVLWREPHTYTYERPKGERVEFGGLAYEMIGTPWFPLHRLIGPATDGKPTSNANKTPSKEEWDLTWEPADGELYFHNRSTDQRVLAKRDAVTQGETPPGAASDHPTERQQKEALAAALKTGYGSRVFSQLLSYGLNLNSRIVDFNHSPSRHITPLEWAVEDERPDLVHLFLDYGADADFTIPSQEGPALVRAVTRKHHSLVETLVQRTANRVSRTRALAIAVEQQDTPLATILLAHGVCCDFEESDRPLPADPFNWDYDSNLSRTLEAEDLTPPLVRAARLGNLALVTLLLEHGADVNVAYHDLGGQREGGWPRDSKIPARFSCGRAVQIAMEMGFPEVVRVLVDAGADVDLAQPAWLVLDHVCQPVPRAAYLEIADGLKDVVAERRGGPIPK